MGEFNVMPLLEDSSPSPVFRPLPLRVTGNPSKRHERGNMGRLRRDRCDPTKAPHFLLGDGARNNARGVREGERKRLMEIGRKWGDIKRRFF